MKRILLITSLLVVALLLINQTEVYTNSANPPDDHTGAPPSNITCAKSGCHATTITQNGDGLIVVTADDGSGAVTVDDNFIYQLGQTYDINITLMGNKPFYGFQMTMLDGGFTSPGTWAVASVSSTTASISSPGSKRFFEHLNAGANNTWTLEWTAPATTAGAVGMYITANFANGNGNSTGDTIYQVSYDITDSIPASIKELPNPFDLHVYPNPATNNNLNIVYTNIGSDVLDIQIYDQMGRLAQYIPGDIVQGRIHRQLNLELQKGIYLLQVRSNEGSSYKKVMIQ